MDIRSTTAAQNYAAARTLANPKTETGEASGLAKFATDFADTMQAGESAAMTTMSGGADAHSLVEALAQTELAVEAAVTVRDKVVEAYQEILRMPV